MNYVPLSAGGYVMPQIDDYQYDPLNRIQQVSESQQSSAGQVSFLFTQKYAYDRWGNRTIDVPGTTPSIPGVTRKNFVVNTATNRLTSSDGCAMTYDGAGNQTYDCVGTHFYDAENRMTKAVQGSSNNYYFHDGSGKRVRRILNGSQTWGGQETWFVYGFDGELVAEYAYNQVTASLATAPQKEYGYRGGKLLVVWDGTQTGDDQLKWLVTDHLGSTRMEANKSGSLAGIRRHDYLPFGEELVASTGAQRSQLTNVYEPPPTNVRQKYGSKERDIETGLDFFGARYFASVQGRLTSPDDFLNDTHPADPASWNLYTYVRNNPLTYVDPDGEEVYSTNLTDKQKKQLIKDWQNKTGYKKIYFDKNNKLTIDTAAGFKGGSAAARRELLAAVESTSKVFNLRAVSGTEAQEVAFADNKGVEDRIDAKGDRTNIYDTRIDFGDFKQLKGDKDAKKAFTIGITLIHEFEHGLHEGAPSGKDLPALRGFPGWLETLYINPIRNELGLARRFDYSAIKYGNNAEVRFRTNKGTIKILRWQDSVVGGKHK